MNYRQANLPAGAEPLPNERGTAPGIRLELLGGIAYAMPGPPHEMQAMFAASVLPDLLRRAGEPAVVVHRVLHTSGMWESAVAEAMAPEVERLASQVAAGQDRNPTIAFLASGGQTRVRISARAANRAEAVQTHRTRSRRSAAKRSARACTASTTTRSKAWSTGCCSSAARPSPSPNP